MRSKLSTIALICIAAAFLGYFGFIATVTDAVAGDARPAAEQACSGAECAQPDTAATPLFLPFIGNGDDTQTITDDDDDDHHRPTATPAKTPAPSPTPTPTQRPQPTPSATPPSQGGIPEHLAITSYEGPKTCVACHAEEANGALHSIHIQWKGDTPDVPNIPDATGKWEQVNTYCTAPAPADFACRSCHASTGKVANLTEEDVDCLVCHQDKYQRSLGPLNDPVSVVDWTGTTRTYQFPRKNAAGEYEMLPRYDLMAPGTTMAALAQSVHMPTRTSCLRCHATAGGGDGTKRGDLNKASANPSVTSDFHMSPNGANLLCQDCHQTENHQIPGRGIDLRPSEGSAEPACTDCHEPAPHAASSLNQHTSRVACQSCHIPTYGKDSGTEMSRDWTEPEWNPGGCQGQGAWIGTEVREYNVKPEYRFWNGQSYVYDSRQPITADADGVYTMARALGSIDDGKLYPVKVHYSYQPRHDESGRMVMYDVLWNFMTGKYEEAAQRGVAWMGLTGPYSWVDTRAEQLITHGVVPEGDALQCNNCHNGGGQVDFDALGYTLKGPESAVCTQCHEQEDDNLSFTKLHSKHVTDKRYDCQWCHTFSRPERNLRQP